MRDDGLEGLTGADGIAVFCNRIDTRKSSLVFNRFRKRVGCFSLSEGGGNVGPVVDLPLDDDEAAAAADIEAPFAVVDGASAAVGAAEGEEREDSADSFAICNCLAPAMSDAIENLPEPAGLAEGRLPLALLLLVVEVVVVVAVVVVVVVVALLCCFELGDGGAADGRVREDGVGGVTESLKEPVAEEDEPECSI